MKRSRFEINWSKLSLILAVISVLSGGVFTTFKVIDARYAKAEIAQENRVDINILKLQRLKQDAQQEYYQTKRIARQNPTDDEAQLELELAKSEYKTLKTQFDEAKLKQELKE